MLNTASIATHLPPELAAKFRLLCAASGQPGSVVLREMIEAYCDDVGAE